MLAEVFVELHPERDVVVDGHRERRGFLEHHADLGAQHVQILLWVEDIRAVQQDLPGGFLFRIELVHAVEGAQQRGFAATGRADERGHHFFRDVQVDVLERAEIPVIEIQVFDDHLRVGDGFDVHMHVLALLMTGLMSRI